MIRKEPHEEECKLSCKDCYYCNNDCYCGEKYVEIKICPLFHLLDDDEFESKLLPYLKGCVEENKYIFSDGIMDDISDVLHEIRCGHISYLTTLAQVEQLLIEEPKANISYDGDLYIINLDK